MPFHSFDLVECSFTQASAVNCFIHRDEPLRRRAKDHRIFAPPAVRISMGVLFAVNERPAFAKEFDDLRISIKDTHSGKMLDLGREFPRRINRRIDLESVAFCDSKIIGAVAWRGVDAACSGFSGGLVFETHVELHLGISFTESYVLAVHYQ